MDRSGPHTIYHRASPGEQSQGRMPDLSANGRRQTGTEAEIRGSPATVARGNDIEEKAGHIGVEVQPLIEGDRYGLQ